ncbi:MAG: hypothetical protein H6Q90_3429 [Deltaproteobacteria bacterium]|nr:hypothetical protein [Deltaproteobacteria bacterium]
MTQVIEDQSAHYDEYLQRFSTELGNVEVGAFAKYQGRLIKKLSLEEFSAAHVEYTEMARHFTESLERGDTINNVVIKLLREQASALVLKPPAGA